MLKYGHGLTPSVFPTQNHALTHHVSILKARQSKHLTALTGVRKKNKTKTNKPHIVTLSKHCVDKTLKGKPLNSVDHFRNADLQHIKMMR